MTDLADAPLGAAEPLRCPSCLAVHEPEQRYCLECGAALRPRTAPRARLAGGGLDPLVLAAAVAVLLAAVVGLLWAVGPDDDPDDVPFVATAALTETAPTTDTAGLSATDTGPGDTATAPGEAGTGPTDGETDGAGAGVTTQPPATTDPPAATDEPPGTTTAEPDDDWPTGRSGWAVILISEEQDEHTQAEMEALRRTAERRGLTDVGLLRSDDYSSLNGGFRVLYQGPFDTREEARRAALAAKAEGYASAYPRRVAP